VADRPQLALRPASESDADWLLELRNDPAVRSASRRTGAVRPEEHREWLRRTLRDPDCTLLVAELDGRPIGQVRFDRLASNECEISVSVVASHRRRGLGTELIKAGVDWLRRKAPDATVVAEVRTGNDASYRAFRTAGFRETGGRAPEGYKRLAGPSRKQLS
jgi:RimJ/RimL family protein N-acetyltransferase